MRGKKKRERQGIERESKKEEETGRGGKQYGGKRERPVAQLNSGYQLLNYIINEWLTRIVE